jgi:tetratricopeptide (TPR) repeat protein
MRVHVYFLSVLMLAVVSGGCAAHRNGALAKRTSPRGAGAGHDNLFAATLESSDERLKAALFRVALMPTAEAHRQAAFEYRRLGVLDLAYDHLTEAIRLNRTDAIAYDARARISRDWGFPNMAVDDAKRAVSYAPASAAAANTLGTVIQALGELSAAKRWYLRALALDPAAAYAQNNLCYAAVMTREPYATATCSRAVAAAPDSKIARNNLALAYAAANDMTSADRWFKRTGDTATANYNHGIVMMARGAYDEAEHAFHEALLADPEFTLAAARARQARVAARGEEHTSDSH